MGLKTPFLKLCVLTAGVCALTACKTLDLEGRMPDDQHPRIVDMGSPAQDTPLTPVNMGDRYEQGAGAYDPASITNVYGQIAGMGPSYSAGYDSGYTAASATGGIPAPQDSRVTIFPLDGADDFTGASSMGSYSDSAMAMSGGSYGSSAGSYRPGNAQIYFANGSSSLDSKDQGVIGQVAEQAKFSPVDRISVEGHASPPSGSGTVQEHISNLKASMDRTFEVSKNLMLKGVPAEKIRAVSWGDTRQPPGVSDAEARRVDIYTDGAP